MINKIFLVITVYNSEKYIGETIQSIIDQVYKNWKLVIIDDGSTDNSLDIANNCSINDDRITVIHQENQGQTKALYDAMELNDCPYFGWVDADDILAPFCLSDTVKILDNDVTIGMVYTNHILIDQNGTHMGIGNRCNIPYSSERLLIDFMTHHFRLIRSDVFNSIGGICLDDDIQMVQDYDISLKISEVSKIYHHPKSLYYYRIHGNNITITKPKKIIEKVNIAINNAKVRRGLTTSL